ncbi:RNA-binding protein [Limosilactobacillus frumenti DSM 13145]|uniref:RNA-binding protein KhpB n=1 Tax=Limosilactobacillus frumenti DSM 13145 TaxID=1423746 RepID=A0A0R1PB03_9LACO|nr:RNA-binding cell elongation regulator Jag/EloR [Limosilactobacillus frumenti]KRL27828.1 RNA-binding protein [Limosilactobacillus frumenti DSM 13145]MBA2914300.1 KH domain-containing protein [Limosilactobacillus frumenti]QFG73375.1 KH domain-containing protein [Limosilactobacillus frumenti]
MGQFKGATVEEAVKAASQQLGTNEDHLTVTVIQQPRHGFLGIGRRAAVIEAKVKPTKESKPKVAKVAKKVKPAKSKVANKVKSHHQPVQPNHKKADGEIDPAEMKRRHEENVNRVRESSQQLIQYLSDIFTELKVHVEPEIKEVRSHEVVIDLKSEQSGRIIGHHGRRINALEQLSNAFMNYHGASKTIVILDTANYRQRRQKALHTLAERSVTEVVATGQAVFLDPMPARERKQIHKELENNRHVRTYSHGREPYRSVVIAPAN